MLRSSKRKCLFGLISLIIFLCLFSTKKYIVSFDGIVRKARPLDVWEFVMDFNNMKQLNPTILEFRILSDAGKGDEWLYDVTYTEFLHQLPWVTNTAIATYSFKPISDKEYHINSYHKTCFFANITCVHSRSLFIFREERKRPEDTYCLERVEYQCPWILSSFCHNEVIFQRRSIFENLDKNLSG